MQTLEEIKKELENRSKPILIGNSEGLMEERMLVNSFHPQPRIYFSDYVKAHPKGVIFPVNYCSRQAITEPVHMVPEGLYTGEQVWEHPDYSDNEVMKGFNPDFSPWYVFHVKGSTTAINQSIFSAFSKLVNWTFDLATTKQVQIVEISTRYMLYSSNNRKTGIPLNGNLVELQESFNVYVHLIPDITFYHLNEAQEPDISELVEEQDKREEPILDLHPDLLAMFEDLD